MIKKISAALSELLDRWTDIGLLRPSLALTATALMLAGCDQSCVCHFNDSLSDRMAVVKVNLLWDERFQETPTGVTVMAYASNGCLYSMVKSNRTDYAELFLPQGEFTLIAFNQSLNELLPIWFEDFEKFDITRITLSELETMPSFINSGAAECDTMGDELSQTMPLDNNNDTEVSSIAQTVTEPFVQPSPWFALSEPQKVTISEEELMNINTKCSCKVCCCSNLHDAAKATHDLTLKLIPQTYTLAVNLSIQNLPSLASVTAYIRALNRSINLRGESLNERASILLEPWQKKMTSEIDGIILSKTSVLSMALTESSDLVIEFSLTDGKTKLVRTLPLKDQVRIDLTTMTITAELELEEPLPRVEGEAAGAFWVTVTPWDEPTDIDI